MRENITFGKEYSEERYNKVVHACALRQDFEQLAYGDMTEVGEGGINLSGGQKQRISLARAVYRYSFKAPNPTISFVSSESFSLQIYLAECSDADLFLLDSPLSAVDEHTSTHIFDYCIQRLLGDKTVILITHKVNHLRHFDNLGILKSGHLVYYGPPDLDLVFSHFPTWRTGNEGELEELEETKKMQKKEEEELNIETLPEYEDEQETEEQKASKKKAAYLTWIRLAGYGYSILSVLIIIFTQVIRIVSDYWLSFWTKDEFNKSSGFYCGIYGAFVFAFCVMLYIRGSIFYAITCRAASKIFRLMFQRVLHAPMSYFGFTPLGVLLNCFSRDQDKVDEALPDSVHLALVFAMVIITTVVLVCIVLPWYTIIAACLLGCLVFLQFYSYRAASFLRKLSASTNSPIFAHISESFHGLTVLRAFEAEERFIDINTHHVDRNHR